MRRVSYTERGSVTVFAALSFVLIMSVVLVSLEEARCSVAHTYASLLLQTATGSALADYYVPLYDDYDLFAMDTGFGTKERSISGVKNKVMGYSGSNLRGYELSSCMITAYDPFLTQDSKEFLKQARDYGKIGLAEDIATELFERLGIIDGQSKTAQLIEKKLETEKELAVIDGYTLELMKLIDGIDCSSGVSLSGTFSYSVEESFVKRFFVLPISQGNCGINNPAVYADVSLKYVNPCTMTGNIISAAESYLELTAELEAVTDASIRMEKDAVAAAAFEEAKGACLSVLTLVGRTLTLSEEAVETIDKLKKQQEKLVPIVEAYEKVLDEAEEDVAEETMEGLRDSLELMKNYAGISSGGSELPDYDTMRETLMTDIGILEDAVGSGALSTPGMDPDSVRAWIGSLSEVRSRFSGFSYYGLTFDYSSLKKKDISDEVAQGFKTAMSNGFMYLLTDDTDGLTDNVLDSPLLPSEWIDSMKTAAEFSDIAKTLTEEVDSDAGMELFGEAEDSSELKNICELVRGGVEAVGNKLFVAAYVQDHFNSYRSQIRKETVLSCEQEYVLCGNENDLVNLSSAVLKILLIRLALCGVYVFTDSTKQSEAAGVAAAAMGFTGVPFLVSAMKYMILFIWAFEQAMIETSAILRGKKVAIIPGSSSFCVTLSELLTFSKDMIRRKVEKFEESAISLTYDEYLYIFLLLRSNEKLAAYSEDIVQENIRLSHNDNFLLNNCITGFTTLAEYECPAVFLRVGSGLVTPDESITGYTVNVTSRVCY